MLINYIENDILYFYIFYFVLLNYNITLQKTN